MKDSRSPVRVRWRGVRAVRWETVVTVSLRAGERCQGDEAAAVRLRLADSLGEGAAQRGGVGHFEPAVEGDRHDGDGLLAGAVVAAGLVEGQALFVPDGQFVLVPDVLVLLVRRPAGEQAFAVRLLEDAEAPVLLAVEQPGHLMYGIQMG